MKGEQDHAKVGQEAINTPLKLGCFWCVSNVRQPSPVLAPIPSPISSFMHARPAPKALSPGLCTPSFLVAPTASLLLGSPGLQSEGHTITEAAQLGIRSPSPGARL